jgi:hypothetical protein
MEIVHNKKTKSAKSIIPLDAEKAVQSAAFATYSKQRHGVVAHDVLGWRMESTATEGQYVGHSFELMISPAEIDRMIEALQKAKERFALNEIPGDLSKIQHEVTATEE